MHFFCYPSLVKSLPPYCPQKDVHTVNKASTPLRSPPIFQHSPQSTLLSNYIKFLGIFRIHQDVLHIPTQHLLFPHLLESSYVYFRTHCKYPFLRKVFPHPWSPSELLLHSLCSRNTLNTAPVWNVYQVFNDCNWMTCLHTFLPTPLGEPQGQDRISFRLERVQV